MTEKNVKELMSETILWPKKKFSFLSSFSEEIHTLFKESII